MSACAIWENKKLHSGIEHCAFAAHPLQLITLVCNWIILHFLVFLSRSFMHGLECITSILRLCPSQKKAVLEKAVPLESPHLTFEIWVLCSPCLFIYLLYSQKESSSRLHRLCSWNCRHHSPAFPRRSRSPSPQMWCSAVRALEWPRSVRLLICLKSQPPSSPPPPPPLPFDLFDLLPTTVCMSHCLCLIKHSIPNWHRNTSASDYLSITLEKCFGLWVSFVFLSFSFFSVFHLSFFFPSFFLCPFLFSYTY